MRLQLIVLVVVVVGCEKNAPKLEPVSDVEAQAFAKQFEAAALPCDIDKVAAMIDGDAITSRMEGAAKSQETKFGAQQFRDPRSIARIVCAWQQGVEGYRMLHLRTKDGQPRLVMRRLARAPRKSVVIVGYDELMLGKHGTDVKLVDLYSFAQGDWLSNILTSGMDAMSQHGVDGSLDAASQLKKSRELQKDGKFAEALAVIDGLPKNIHDTRMVQMARLRVADQLSEDAYKQALDDLAKLFPNDPSVALVDVDGAFLRGDFAKALEDIDTIDASTGGDPFQDAIRAEVLLKRKAPGDVEKASDSAERAIKTEPTLAKGWWSRLDVAVARKQYPLAIETMDHLRKHFDAKLDDAALRTLPEYADFLASAEYAAWRTAGN
jgi:tetratricopeptide (TPR) repeat protein